MQNRTKSELLHKACNQVDVQHMQIDMRKQYLGKLDNRVQNQEQNVHGLVKYAKKIRGELEDYRNKVEMSERIVKDLQASGNDSVDSLLGMLKKYKRAQKNAADEIEKFMQLDQVKANEIVELNQELAMLHEIQSKAVDTFEQKFENARRTIEENREIIKR